MTASPTTDESLASLLEVGGELAVPYFDGATLRVEPCDVPIAEALPALRRFLALTADQRRRDARHLVAYCKLMIDAVGEDVVLEDLGGVLPTIETIWDHARPTLMFLGALDAGEGVSRRTIYVQLGCEVDWEPEHGMQMSWADGARLVKVGAYDGHPTNGHATGRPEADAYVFSCYLPELCTSPDPA